MNNLKKRQVSGQAMVAGATLGGVAGTGTGLTIASHLGLCALGGMASCGLLLPIIGAAIGGVAAREWIDSKIAMAARPDRRSNPVLKPTGARGSMPPVVGT